MEGGREHSWDVVLGGWQRTQLGRGSWRVAENTAGTWFLEGGREHSWDVVLGGWQRTQLGRSSWRVAENTARTRPEWQKLLCGFIHQLECEENK